MSGSTESVSAEPGPGSRGGRRILVISPNWIGDCVMAMPALQQYRARHPHDHLAILCRPSVAGLWALHGAPDQVMTYTRTARGTWEIIQHLRELRFDKVFVLPNSYRTAFLAWAGRIPVRVGYLGSPLRSLLLNHCLQPTGEASSRHQGWEILGMMNRGKLPPLLPVPALQVPGEVMAEVSSWLEGISHPRIVLLPGAARGPAKRWPAQSFCALGARLQRDLGAGIILAGGPDDVDACEEIALGLGVSCLNLAGRTGLGQWAAVLAQADLVVCNDSGGMHLAAAVSTPVVAVFGMTDPEVTGPLGERVSVVQDAGSRSRKVARRSEEAEKSLAAISPERVYEEAVRWVGRPPAT